MANRFVGSKCLTNDHLCAITIVVFGVLLGARGSHCVASKITQQRALMSGALFYITKVRDAKLPIVLGECRRRRCGPQRQWRHLSLGTPTLPPGG
jgi:hypothetical protein